MTFQNERNFKCRYSNIIRRQDTVFFIILLLEKSYGIKQIFMNLFENFDEGIYTLYFAAEINIRNAALRFRRLALNENHT